MFLTTGLLKSSSEHHVSEEYFSNWQRRAMTRWQSDRVIVSYVPLAVSRERPLSGSLRNADHALTAGSTQGVHKLAETQYDLISRPARACE
jgi:hypothetical protein